MPAQNTTRIALIPVPARETYAFKHYDACLWVGYFVREAIEQAGYEPGELPDDAVSFADLWTYHGEQANGGHEQYYGNTDGDVAAWRRAAILLKTIGLPKHRALLEDFINLSVEDGERLEEMYAEGRDTEARELFWNFDDRFAELERNGNGNGLLVTLDNWLLRQSWIEIDESGAPFTMERMRRSLPPHPLAEERRAARFVA